MSTTMWKQMYKYKCIVYIYIKYKDMYHAVQYAMIIGEFLKMFWKYLVILHYSCWHGTESQKVGPLNKSGMSLLSSRGFSSTSKKTQMRKCWCIINPRSQNQAHGRQLPCPCLADPTEGSFTSYQTKKMLYPASKSFECWGKIHGNSSNIIHAFLCWYLKADS